MESVIQNLQIIKENKMDKFAQLQKLYKVSVSTGKTQVWFGWVDGDTVKCSYGELEGKLQINEYQASAKNLGRSNETPSEQQALIELEAMYQNQVDNKHYKLTEEEAKVSASVCREPRKITNYKDRYNKMSTKLLTSVKKNGSRGCVLEGNFYSKIGRPEDIKVKHLKEAVDTLGTEATFDSEIYAEGLSLQRIRSAWLKPVKTDKEIIKIANDLAKKRGFTSKVSSTHAAVKYLGYNPNEDAGKLKFFVFDIPDNTNKKFSERANDIDLFFEKVDTHGLGGCFEFLQPVETNSHEERMLYLEEVVSQGNEGLVHYDPEGVYEFGKRSTNTAKSKPRYDSEALVTGVEMCKNGEGKLLLQACDELDKVKFKAMMKGSHESRMFDVQNQFIGKWVTFSYEELSEAGVPTKPVVHETRLCDEDGQPLE